MTNQNEIEVAVRDRFSTFGLHSDCSEWRYTMRRTMQELVEGVFLGPYASAVPSRRDLLVHHGITHILCVRHQSEAPFIRPHFPSEFHYLVLNIAESPNEDIVRHFPTVKMFIDECLTGSGKVLIHGNTGNSRSAALAIGYIMETFQLSLRDAHAFVGRKRSSICLNRGFISQLSKFELFCKTQNVLKQGQTSGDNGRRHISVDTEPLLQ